MFEFIQDAGFGIYPVLLFGFASIAVAVKHYRGRGFDGTAMCKWLMALTGVAGVLGLAVGMQVSASALHLTDKKWLFAVGLQESLNNVVAAGVLVVIAMLILLADATRTAMASAESAERVG